MATKSVSASTAVAKRAGTNIMSIQAELKKINEGMAERVAPASGISISIKGSEFRLPDGRKTKEPLEVVVVDFAAMNSFYEAKFDAANMTSPVCFAIGQNPLKLVPSDNSTAKQSDECSGCPMNEYGSDGKGKACKNTRVLAILPPDGDAETPLWKLSVPPTSIKNWDAYVRSVSSMFQMSPLAVVTTISFDDTVDYPRLNFSNPQPNNALATHFPRLEEARTLLATEPDTSAFAAAKPATKPAAKKVAAGARRRV